MAVESWWRRCYGGGTTWLNDVEPGRQYAAGDALGCMGMWFAGRWYTAGAVVYIGRVTANRNGRAWESADFLGHG